MAETAAPEEQGVSTLTEDPPEVDSPETEDDDLDTRATILLGVQQISSSFSYRACEFAYPLYFIVLYTNTLLPASLYGFLITGSAIIFSGSVGSLTDRYRTHRLQLVRFFIITQKLLVVSSYVLFFVLFQSETLRQAALNGGKGPDLELSNHRNANVWLLFAVITILGCFLILANVGVSVSIERDWVTSISRGSSRRLTRLNAIMRRIDLLSKLLAPLFVSLLTTVTGYGKSCLILLAISAGTTFFEVEFIGIIFRKFEILAEEESRHREQKRRAQQQQQGESDATYPPLRGLARTVTSKSIIRLFFAWSKEQYVNWRSFIAMPIFISSISISLLYMSVLSFDSTFIAYLKSETTYSDAFIAGMRGVCVVTGLMGTFLSPYLTTKIGLVRTGSYSLWIELVPLSLSVVSFYKGADSRHRPAWNTALLFTGLALSRIGLWSFDLAQLAQVQVALSSHPNRNALMGLQFALQNVFDLFHYAITIIFSKPSLFKIPVDISFAAIALSTLLYITVYARRERGHLLHLDHIGLQSLFGKKDK